jgi:hypothetical protein
MEGTVRVKVARLPAGAYLATSDEVHGLVAQGRSVVGTLEIVREAVRKLLEAQAERSREKSLPLVPEEFALALVVGH